MIKRDNLRGANNQYKMIKRKIWVFKNYETKKKIFVKLVDKKRYLKKACHAKIIN